MTTMTIWNGVGFGGVGPFERFVASAFAQATAERTGRPTTARRAARRVSTHELRLSLRVGGGEHFPIIGRHARTHTTRARNRGETYITPIPPIPRGTRDADFDPGRRYDKSPRDTPTRGKGKGQGKGGLEFSPHHGHVVQSFSRQLTHRPL